MERSYIPVDEFVAVLRRIAPDEPVSSLAERIAAASGTLAASEERGLRRIIDGEALSVGLDLADRIFTGLGHHEALDLLVDWAPPSPLVCENCGKEIEPGVMPVDLMRPDPTAMHGRVWDSTKQKWVWRPKNAKAGGRRFRAWNLCRKCRAEALRERAHKMDGRGIRTRDRLPPKRGGRPRLLNEDELRSAYKVYLETGLSMNEIANRLHASRERGTPSGYAQSLLYGWRKLGLKLRSRSAQVAISVHGQPVTWKPKQSRRCKVRLRNGRRCTQWVRMSGNRPAEDGLCWNHAMQAKRKEEAA